MSEPDGVELALFACLRYEEAALKVANVKERWDINEKELEAVLKYFNNRMNDIKSRLKE